MKKALWLLSLLVLTVSLTACGGSSGSSDTTTSTPSGLSGAVAAAPVKDASVMVDYKYLTAAAQKAAKTEDAIKVGYTNASGAIVFDDAAMAKVDRTKDVVLYSKDGVKFTSAYNTMKAVKDADTEATDLFKGQLRAILAKGATTAYLTPANTIVADRVAAGDSYEVAKEFALNLLQNKLGLIAMENPLGNPLANLTKSEFVSQAIFEAYGTSEAAVTAGNVSFAASAPRSTPFTAAELTTLATKTKTALKKDGVVVDEAALKADAVVTTKQRTIDFKFTNTAAGFLKALDKEKARAFSVKEADLDEALTFTIAATTVKGNEAAIDNGEFVLKAFEGSGKVFFNGIDATVGTKFNSAVGFTFKPATSAADGVPTEADMKAFKAATITFEAVDAEGKAVKNIQPIVITITKIAPKEILVTQFDMDSTYTTIVELDASGNPVSAQNKIIGGNVSKNAATMKMDLAMINALTKEDLAKALVRFTAPAGYQFTAVTGAADQTAKVSTIDWKFNPVGEVATYEPSATAKFVKLGPTAVEYEIKTMTAEVIVDEKVVVSKTITVGFGATADTFTAIRDLNFGTATATTKDYTVDNTALDGIVPATFNIIRLAVDKANNVTIDPAYLETAVGNAPEHAFNAFVVKASATETALDAALNLAAAGLAKSFPIVVDSYTYVDGVATMKFDFAKANATPAPLVFKAPEQGDFIARIVLGAVTDEKVAAAKAGLNITSKAEVLGTFSSFTVPAKLSAVTVNDGAGTSDKITYAAVNATILSTEINAKTETELEKTSHWTFAYTPTLNAPNVPAFTVAATANAGKTGYDVVFTFTAQATHTADYVGKMTVTDGTDSNDVVDLNISGY